MTIYIVQPGDNITLIADTYGVSVTRLIEDNELDNPYDLVPGQTVVIVHPEQTYTVQEEDTLGSIASAYGITVMQLLRNNPFLSEREYIYPGETLVISYKTDRKIITNGFAYPFINIKTLRKTLPYLTYLSIFNYSASAKGDIISYEDETGIIQMAKDYGVVPLMMITTLSSRGTPNIEIAYQILLNEEHQNRHLESMINILRTKGFYGVNMVFSYMSPTNMHLYENFISKVSERLKQEGYLYFVTVNTNMRSSEGQSDFEKIDFTSISQKVDGIVLISFSWGSFMEAPGPISFNRLFTYCVKM